MSIKSEITGRALVFTMLFSIMISSRFAGATAADPLHAVPVDDHHVVGIGSGQPYVAGFHVLTDDFYDYRMIDGAMATVAFLSTNATCFPAGSWLGAGLFLQAQDHTHLFIDYGFYMIVALDSSGNLFVDVGLHQTMEGSLPVQAPDSRLVYTYTWQLSGIEPATKVTLLAQWTPEGLLNYSIRTEAAELSLTSIKVRELSDCEDIMPYFYTGNVVGQLFPFGRCVDFFQFGVTGSEIIPNNQWTVLLENARYLKQDAWMLPEKAWSTQGDHSYLDHDATWGGEPYTGVNVQYLPSTDQNGSTLIFSYEGRTLKPGTVLWDHSQAKSNLSSIRDLDSFPTLLTQLTIWSVLSTIFAVLFALHRKNHRYVTCK